MRSLFLGHKKTHKVILLGMFVLSLLASTPAPLQGGEVLDHLPEIQLARGWYPAFLTFLEHVFSPASAQEECQDQPDATDLSKIPNNLWIKGNGEIRSPHEVQVVLDLAMCNVLLNLEQETSQLAQVNPNKILFDVVSGKQAQFGENLLDGTKQPIRMAVLPFILTLLSSELRQHGSAQDGILGESPCDALIALVNAGASVEIRYSAFFVLKQELLDAIKSRKWAPSAPAPNTCLSLPEGSEDELLLMAQRGSLGAAAQLELNWATENTEALLNELATYLSQVTQENPASIKVQLQESGPVKVLEQLPRLSQFDFLDFWLQVDRQQISQAEMMLLAHWGEPLITLAITDLLAGLHAADYSLLYLRCTTIYRGSCARDLWLP